MGSKNLLSQNDLSRELHKFHDELEAYNDFLNDSEVRRSQTPLEFSIFQSNLHIQEKQIYEKKMEFLSDEKFFQDRSDKTSQIIKKVRNGDEGVKTIISENFDKDEAKKEQKGFLKRISQISEPGSITFCVLMILSCSFSGCIFVSGAMFWVGGVPLALISMMFFGLLSYYGIYLLVISCDSCKRYTFSGLAEASFPNKWINNPMKAILFINNWGIMTLNLFLVQSLIKELIIIENIYEISAFMVLALLPLSLLRELKKIRFLFLIGLILPCYLLGNSIYIFATAPSKDTFEYKPMNAFIIFRIYNFCMFSFPCQNNIPDIFQELKENSLENMKKALRISFVCLALLNIFIGIFTSIKTETSFPEMDARIKIFDDNARVLFILYIILTLPLRVKTSKEVLLDVFFPKEGRDSFPKHFFLTFFTLSLCILPSSLLYFLQATSTTNQITAMLNPLVCFTFPAIFVLKMKSSSRNGFFRKTILFLFIFVFTFVGIINFFYEKLLGDLNQSDR